MDSATSIQEAIRRLEAAGFRFNPPASEAAIAEMGVALECVLPPEIVALYRHGDGTRPYWLDSDYDIFAPPNEGPGGMGSLFRLMPVARVVHLDPYLERSRRSRGGRRCFWGFDFDGPNVYAAAYVQGPLAGRVCVLDREHEIDPSPIYRSVASFVSAQAAAGKWGFLTGEYGRMPGADYPALGPVGAGADVEARADAEAARALWPLLQAARRPREREQHALALLALTPYEQTDTLLPFTADEAPRIVMKACDVLAMRRWEPAVGHLAQVLLRCAARVREADIAPDFEIPAEPREVRRMGERALLALGRIGTAKARRAVVRLHETLLPADDANRWCYAFEQALAACGCEMDDRNMRDIRYREPGMSEWKPTLR